MPSLLEQLPRRLLHCANVHKNSRQVEPLLVFRVFLRNFMKQNLNLMQRLTHRGFTTRTSGIKANPRSHIQKFLNNENERAYNNSHKHAGSIFLAKESGTVIPLLITALQDCC